MVRVPGQCITDTHLGDWKAAALPLANQLSEFLDHPHGRRSSCTHRIVKVTNIRRKNRASQSSKRQSLSPTNDMDPQCMYSCIWDVRWWGQRTCGRRTASSAACFPTSPPIESRSILSGLYGTRRVSMVKEWPRNQLRGVGGLARYDNNKREIYNTSSSC